MNSWSGRARIIAYQPETDSYKFLVEFTDIQDNNRFSILTPPNYLPQQLMPVSLVEAALVKYNFLPASKEVFVESSSQLTNITEHDL